MTAFDSFGDTAWGPWGDVVHGECGCEWQDDPQGHRLFTVWNFECGLHAKTIEEVR